MTQITQMTQMTQMAQNNKNALRTWQRWERQVHEERLLGCHHILKAQEYQQNVRSKKFITTEQRLLEGMKRNWSYVKKSNPTPIEVAWIIYSQIAWKFPDSTLEEEELWEDLPEIDPLEIILLCKEIEDEQSNQLTPDTLVPAPTLFGLKNILDLLAKKGIDIREEKYSQNWIRKKKRHRSGRLQEIKAREKNDLEKMADKSQASSSLVRKTKDMKKKQKIQPQKKTTKSPVKILASFFGLA